MRADFSPKKGPMDTQKKSEIYDAETITNVNTNKPAYLLLLVK